MKKSFTINPFRTTEEFLSYYSLIREGFYHGVEIFYPYQLSLEAFETYQKNCQNLKETFPNLKMVLHLPHGHQNSVTLEETRLLSMPRMKESILFAARFGVDRLTLHLGTVDKNKSREEYIKEIIAPLQILCDEASKYHMVLMIENMPSTSELGCSPEEILTIICNTKRDNLKFILDTGHAHVSKYPLTDYVYLLKEQLYHMHFNDNNGTRDEHKRMGQGNIDFLKLFDALKEIGYDHLHCMEVIFQNAQNLVDFSKDLDKYI